MAIISANKACFGYDTGLVLRDISFSVEAGEYLCIVGENGSGKTTLMKGLTGQIKLQSGTLTFDGISRLGYLPQQMSVRRDFPASVWEITLSGCIGQMKSRIFYSKKERQCALHNLKLMGIAHLKNRSFIELSGGQQQRVLIARALCATDKVLLLDEPTAGLDPSATKELYELLAHLNRYHGITIIIISHDIHASLAYGTKILHLKDTVKFFGTTDEYRESEAIKLLNRENKDV